MSIAHAAAHCTLSPWNVVQGQVLHPAAGQLPSGCEVCSRLQLHVRKFVHFRADLTSWLPRFADVVQGSEGK